MIFNYIHKYSNKAILPPVIWQIMMIIMMMPKVKAIYFITNTTNIYANIIWKALIYSFVIRSLVFFIRDNDWQLPKYIL